MTYIHHMFLLGAVVFGTGVFVGSLLASLLRTRELKRLDLMDELNYLAKEDEAHLDSMMANHAARIAMDNAEYYAQLDRAAALDEHCDNCTCDDVCRFQTDNEGRITITTDGEQD